MNNRSKMSHLNSLEPPRETSSPRDLVDEYQRHRSSNEIPLEKKGTLTGNPTRPKSKTGRRSQNESKTFDDRNRASKEQSPRRDSPSKMQDYRSELETQFPGDPTMFGAPNTTLFLHTDWN